MISITRREAFDEWTIGHTRIQFFEPKLWQWGWPKWVRGEGDLTVAFPTMSIKFTRK